MSESIAALADYARELLADSLVEAVQEVGELTLIVRADKVKDALVRLRDGAAAHFEQLIDLSGVDYLQYGEGTWTGPRFAVVYHLLSVSLNQRVRVRTFLDDSLPRVDSVVDVWAVANWYEREAFDLFGIVFEGHPDLRRILTDYGFVGHPFRKDFPLIGYVEMRYDPEKKRVIYQPVSIEPRILVPRVIREEGYGGRDT